MDYSNAIALLAIASTIIIALIGWSKDKHKDDKGENSILVELRTDMRYNTKKLDSIEKRLNSIEEKLDNNALKVAKHESDIKTLFENLKLHLYRIRRLENHIGIGDSDEARD